MSEHVNCRPVLADSKYNSPATRTLSVANPYARIYLRMHVQQRVYSWLLFRIINKTDHSGWL